MLEYSIKVIKQKRILLSILIMAIAIPFCLFISTKLELTFLKIILPLLILVIITTLLYYFSFGQIKITLQNEQLDFKWNKKPIFNFREYESIRIDEITAIIVEE